MYNLVEEVFPCGNTFLDRCSAIRGVTPKPFRMNCKKGGGVVVTQKPPLPTTGKKGGGVVTPKPPLPTTGKKGCVDVSSKCNRWTKYCNSNKYY
ncbi:hypothetical protein, partial [Salmonella sp. s54412]|uniref:hypothetical protein n=1 Tax=Salmonella sp. s54412 TaxID=3160128 RepID=UPI003755250D